MVPLLSVCQRFSLSLRERAGVRASVCLYLNRPQRASFQSSGAHFRKNCQHNGNIRVSEFVMSVANCAKR